MATREAPWTPGGVPRAHAARRRNGAACGLGLQWEVASSHWLDLTPEPLRRYSQHDVGMAGVAAGVPTPGLAVL